MCVTVYQQQYPPNSLPTDITLSQFLSIQEKGVSAWAFEPDYESNPAVIVQSRTELGFLADAGIDGACCVQSNLPLPKLNEVYYWEAKMYELPPGTTVSIGLATKPFPSFRMPGWNKHSIGYFSSDGFKSTAYPFLSTSYGPALTEGDVLGVGYRPRSGTVFFTRNGKRLPDAFTGLGYGLSAGNVFPTVAADGAAAVHVNLGQAGFVFIEANVKKWGLAPMLGTLAPPPAYGAERGSILLEAAQGTSSGAAAEEERRRLSAEARAGPSRSRNHRSRRPPPVPISPSASFTADPAGAVSALANPNQPARPSPLRHSRHPSSTVSPSLSGSISPGPGGRESESDDEPQNPPTPGLLDISLHSLHRFPAHPSDDESEEEATSPSSGSGSVESELSEDELPRRRTRPRRAYDRPPAGAPQPNATGLNVEPPAYHPYDPAQYAPGVAEAIIEDAFSNLPSAARHHPHHTQYAFPGAQPGRPQPQRVSSRGASVPIGATGGPGGQAPSGSFARALRNYFFGEDNEDRVSAAEAGRA